MDTDTRGAAETGTTATVVDGGVPLPAQGGAVGGTAGYLHRTVADAPVQEVFPGIRCRPLWTGENGASAMVVELDPGSCWEGVDLHEPGPEEVFVVDGVFHDGDCAHPAGTFIHAPAGSWHIPQSAKGCTLFVFYPEG